MRRLRALFADRKGAAAVEMVMVTPLLLVIMFGATEMGRFFWSEHQLIKAVRDASIYASRQPIANFTCPSTVSAAVVNDVRDLVRTGVLSGGTDKLANWSGAGASINVSMTCVTASGGTALGGIYTANFGQVPVLTINATLPYNSIMHGFGVDKSFTMKANQQAVVMGV